jgi:CrcB protein
MRRMRSLVLVMLAGALGTLCRVGCVRAATELFGPRFPWGTAIVNLLGCVAFGAVLTLATERARLSPEARFVLLSGFMGAFTTFSSLVGDTAALWTSGRPVLAVLNAVGQNVLGYLCFAVGTALPK